MMGINHVSSGPWLCPGVSVQCDVCGEALEGVDLEDHLSVQLYSGYVRINLDRSGKPRCLF